MTDWEAWLKAAAAPPSDNEDSKRDRSEREVKQALAASDRLRGREYIVYAKGSYANNTNVRLNYDVDIAVEYRGFFFYDLDFELRGQPASKAGIVPASDPYSPDEFKSDIRAALVSAFGRSAVDEGSIAYRVRARAATLPTDVVPSWEYRRYDGLSASGSPIWSEGSRVLPARVDTRTTTPRSSSPTESRRTRQRRSDTSEWSVR